LKKKINLRGFTLVEILIVLVIAGLGLMTIAPRLAEKTILSDNSEVFFNELISSNLALAKELNKQVYITGYKGSQNIVTHDEKRLKIPTGLISSVYINEEKPQGTQFRIYFYPDGIFDQFRLVFADDEEVEGIPALHMAVHR